MKRKSNNYATADGGGWMHRCDDLFLAQFRGRPCEICGRRGGFDNGKKISSCGHHLTFKGRCRQFRYTLDNIIVLCPHHHSHYNSDLSPHSITSTHAQAAFEEWVRDNKPKQYAWWMENQHMVNKPFDKTWTYREMYVALGGEIETKTGHIKDYRPVRHKPKVDRLVEVYRQVVDDLDLVSVIDAVNRLNKPEVNEPLRYKRLEN